MTTCVAYGSSWLGVESELQLRPMPQPQQLQIWATSATYTTAHSNAGSLTHWARPGMEPMSSWIPVGLEPWRERSKCYLYLFACLHQWLTAKTGLYIRLLLSFLYKTSALSPFDSLITAKETKAQKWKTMVRATRVSISGWMDEQNVVHPYNGVLKSLKKEGNSDK